jgi:hypothetical protein
MSLILSKEFMYRMTYVGYIGITSLLEENAQACLETYRYPYDL